MFIQKQYVEISLPTPGITIISGHENENQMVFDIGFRYESHNRLERHSIYLRL